MTLDPLRGQLAPFQKLTNVASLVADYYTVEPSAPVAFGTSGHRGKASRGSFNEGHVASITAAVVDYRNEQGYKGPLFLGFDTHALSQPAWRTALTILAQAQVPTVISQNQEFAPTPVISFLILEHNQKNPKSLADGIIITPSHNPPEDGGIKYNPPHGGPADVEVTNWIEKRAYDYLNGILPLRKTSLKKALKAGFILAQNFIKPFTEALGEVIDFEAIKSAGLKLGADPLGGSGVHYWEPIAERWGLNLTVVNPKVDPSFSFMTLDSDGVIRMDCSSPYAMANLLKHGKDFDLAFGNDPDFDRHGIVSGGKLMNPNHFLAVAIHYLLGNRPEWSSKLKVGKTLVSSSIINRVVAGAGREIFETPVGFKWFVPGLQSGELAFGGEESAGASFLRKNGTPWTTDKCGFCMALLAAEIMAKTSRAPHEIYASLTEQYGETDYQRIDSDLTEDAKTKLTQLDLPTLVGQKCGGKTIVSAFDRAPGNNASIGGFKVNLEDGSWFAIRPSGTEPKIKLYVESFSGPDFKDTLLNEVPKLILGV
ncbi:MAG: phosphoglucomutase, alpha-D-glucose phosphate-specific [Deltaproteobacteria bacterium]|jgi:phosphoglucomutase|nr:phosphoglucomutase, alpha-D-glucose phosphate-specific [Deltaproteobacteria bacterium]